MLHWAEITAAPPRKILKQFSLLWVVFFVGLAAWRLWDGEPDAWAGALAAIGVIGGAIGAVRPEWMRWIYTGWMVAVFPIGWTISRLTLLALFYIVFMPVALLFRLIGRDALRRRRREARTYWMPKTGAASSAEYLRQF
jgi:hypothetical protein